LSLLNDIFAFASGPALKTVISWLSMPIVANVPIQTTSYKEICNSDVSEMPVISPTSSNTSGKNFITDNSAPRPRQWEIQGFIGSILQNVEPSSLAMVLQPSLIFQKRFIQEAWLKRAPVNFIPLNRMDLGKFTKDGIQVQIKSLSFDTQPQITNKIPISITLVEIPYIVIRGGVQHTTNSAISNVTGQSIGAGSVTPVQVPL
jgi:hypothetical protein